MGRSRHQVQHTLLQYRPPGWVFPDDRDSYFSARLLAWANEIATIEASQDALLPQFDPRYAVDLLPDFERVLGPHSCGPDPATLSFQQRAAIAYQRWTAGGNICAGFFVALAAMLGISISIIEVQNWVCGGSTCDDQMVPYAENFAIQVNLPAESLSYFECGVATCDDSLGTFTPTLAQCALMCGTPLHITFCFNFETSVSGAIDTEDGVGFFATENGLGPILMES